MSWNKSPRKTGQASLEEKHNLRGEHPMPIEIKIILYIPTLLAFIYWVYTISRNSYPTWGEAFLNILPLLITLLLPSIVQLFFKKPPNKVHRMKARKDITGLSSLLKDKDWGEKAAFALIDLGGEESAKALVLAITSSTETPPDYLFFSLRKIDDSISRIWLEELTKSESEAIRTKAKRALEIQREVKESLKGFTSLPKIPKVDRNALYDWIMAARGEYEMARHEDQEVDQAKVKAYRDKVWDAGKSVYEAGGITALKQLFDDMLADQPDMPGRLNMKASLKGYWEALDGEIKKW
jgi:hypothetical protein